MTAGTANLTYEVLGRYGERLLLRGSVDDVNVPVLEVTISTGDDREATTVSLNDHSVRELRRALQHYERARRRSNDHEACFSGVERRARRGGWS